MELKSPLSFEKQLERLKEQGMAIEDEEWAVTVLKKINYYRFTGYALGFRIDPQISVYKQGTTFARIYDLYLLDEQLRDVLRVFIEKAEIYYRTQIAYGFAMSKCQNPPHDQHYYEENFYNREGYKQVVGNLQKEKNYYRDTLIVKHHQTKYESKMPLWVMVELMSFSDMSKLYKSMYISEKEVIANAVGVQFTTLENHLHCLSVLRNKCAHAARLYDSSFNPKARFTKTFLKNNPAVKEDSLFAYILVLMKRLPDKESKIALKEALENVLKEHKIEAIMEMIGFPVNYESLLKNIL